MRKGIYQVILALMMVFTVLPVRGESLSTLSVTEADVSKPVSQSELEVVKIMAKIETKLLQTKTICIDSARMADTAADNSIEAKTMGDMTGALLMGMKAATFRNEFNYCNMQAELTAFKDFYMELERLKAKEKAM